MPSALDRGDLVLCRNWDDTTRLVLVVLADPDHDVLVEQDPISGLCYTMSYETFTREVVTVYPTN